MGSQKQIVFSLWIIIVGIANSYSQDSFNFHFGRSIPISDFPFQNIIFSAQYDDPQDLLTYTLHYKVHFLRLTGGVWF